MNLKQVNRRPDMVLRLWQHVSGDATGGVFVKRIFGIWPPEYSKD